MRNRYSAGWRHRRGLISIMGGLQPISDWLDTQTNVRNWHLNELIGLVAFESTVTGYPGSELYTTANAASDPAGNEANATTGWLNAISTMTSDGTIKAVGDYSLKVVATGNGGRMYFDLDTILTIGDRVKLSIDARHLGSGGVWNISLGVGTTGLTTVIESYTNSDTTFEPAIITFTHSTNSRYLVFRELSGTDDGGMYGDNISAAEANPLDLDNSGLLIAQDGAGNIQYMYSGTGAAAERLSFNPITQYTADFDRANGGKVITAKASTWAAGIDVLWHSGVDATNFVEIRRDGTDLIVEYQEAGNQSIATVPSGSPSGAFTIAASWDTSGFGIRAIYNGVQVDTDKAIGSAIVGALDITLCALFAADSSGANTWAGSGAEASLQIETKDVSWYADYHSRTGV